MSATQIPAVPTPQNSQWTPATTILGELARLGPDTTGLREELREILFDTIDDLPY
jgi:hypothetical protein